ncbi:type II secretory pathway pseudopilin PulG [Streptacidiphilus sp. MAP12-16]|uniref:divisome protein SepX/GlpR n=1 Tax=Streptacidiphilus sp. MAP12-16 TaxID=3156300 RepID=UPI003515FBE4
MSSSGLIYAVIVGAWAAYLVPMWLRRQDELNEARPTERFSTAIRLLSGRAAMERRVSRHLDDDNSAGSSAGNSSGESTDDSGPAAPAAGAAAADHRASSPAPVQSQPTSRERSSSAGAPRPEVRRTPPPGAPSGGATGRRLDPKRRAALLARRRRLVILLFAVFTAGMVTAAVGGVALLWVPAIPAVLFSLYIAHLRRQERRRFEVKLDRRRAAEAAQRVRERERERRRAAAAPDTQALSVPRPPDFAHPDFARPDGRSAAGAVPQVPHRTRALVEAADPDESDDWGDNPRDRSTDPESWDPVPVPLPTYVTAPVAPRSTGSLDLNAPDTWSAGRAVVPPPPAQKRPPATPLFDQYADDAPHPRAANE